MYNGISTMPLSHRQYLHYQNACNTVVVVEVIVLKDILKVSLT